MIVVAIGAAGVGAWTEGGTLLFLFSLSNALEHFANYRTEQTISSLLKSAPETAFRRQNGTCCRRKLFDQPDQAAPNLSDPNAVCLPKNSIADK